ncbi:AraC family transcriptional regulator [Bradyrhizobium sp. 23AC]
MQNVGDMENIVVEIRNYPGEIERHQHDYHQVILPRSGCLEIEIDHRGGRVAEGIGSFVPAGSTHAFFAKQCNAFVVLDIPLATMRTSLCQDRLPTFFAIGPDIRGLLDYMAAIDDPARLSRPLRMAWSTLLIDRLSRRTPPDRLETALQRAEAFMKRRLAEPIRIIDIAEAAGISQTKLHSAFRYRRSTTPYTLLMGLRLDAAELLLADPRLSIAEIAHMTGHADQSSLTRIMQRERGTTPGEIRRSLLSKQTGKA